MLSVFPSSCCKAAPLLYSKTTLVRCASINQTRKNFSSSFHQNDDDSPIEMENPYKVPPKRCPLCGVPVDYKNVQLLSQFVSSFTGLKLPKKSTPLCDKKYEEVMEAIRLSRMAGFMPFMVKEPTFLDDPTFNRKDIHSYQE